MLILDRKDKQVIWIGETKVVIVKSSRGRVKLGIEAPAYINVRRGEVKPKGADK